MTPMAVAVACWTATAYSVTFWVDLWKVLGRVAHRKSSRMAGDSSNVEGVGSGSRPNEGEIL